MPIGAIVAGGATLGSALIGASSAKKAANAQVQGNREAIAAQERMLERIIGLNEPFRQGGITSLGMIMDGFNDGSLLEGPNPANFRTDPGYQFRLNEGIKAVEGGAAARGLLQSGGTLKGVNNYAQGVADQAYGDWWNRERTIQGDKFNRLSAVMGGGQTAVNQVGGATQNAGNNMSQLLANSGAARASGYAGAGAAWQQGLGSLASILGGFGK